MRLGAKDELKVYFQDEGRFGRMANPVSCWAPKPLRPNLPLQRIREYTYVYSAVCPQDEDVFSLILPRSDSEMMSIFLREFAEYRDSRKTLMIMDQAPWHVGKDVKAQSSVLVEYQPAYSSELNPAEHFWDHVREKYTSNRFWNSMNEMEDFLCSSLAECQKDRETIKSFSSFDWMVYK